MPTEPGIVEKAVHYVKEMFTGPSPDSEGMPIEPATESVFATDTPSEAQDKPKYPDSGPEIASEDAMRLNPNPYAVDSIEQMDAEVTGETDAERLRREVGEPRQKTAFERNSSARLEDGE